METITVTNFGGRLTRILNGELNSGLAKFNPSWGNDPFSKPMNLTWLEAPTSIASGVTDLMLAMKTRNESNQQYVYGVGSTGNLYRIQTNSASNPNVDSIVGISSVKANAPSYNYGASMEFFGDTQKIYVASDNQINSINFDGTADAVVGNSNQYTAAGGHVLKPFVGKLIFGNGNTVGAIGSTGTITSSIIGTGQGNLYSELNPPLPVTNTVHDIDISPDGNQLLITASEIANEALLVAQNDGIASSSSEGYQYKWNGTDDAITSFSIIPSYAITALQTYLNSNLFFSNDAFGSSLSDGVNKIVTLQNNKSPFPNATLVNGNFICWIVPEVSSDGTQRYASMYYFGSLDAENPPGLFRLMRYSSSLANGFVYQTPANILTNNRYSTVNGSRSSIVSVGLGKHYFSTYETSAGTQTSYKFFRFFASPSGTGTPQLGVYETQTQLFSKKIDVKQIRVYTEPTAANNGFQIDLIGGDGGILTNGTFNYTFVAGSDTTLVQGALERINFNPKAAATYSLGLRITNTGTANMTIKKIEVDWDYSGK